MTLKHSNLTYIPIEHILSTKKTAKNIELFLVMILLVVLLVL